MPSKPTAIDMFSGCGGTTQGLRAAGFRVLAGVEIDPLAVATYRVNHKSVKAWDCDIRDLTVKAILGYHGLAAGDLDLLAGCPPCQAFSTMTRLSGRRRIRDKESKDLIFEYIRFVRGLRPKVVLIENVPRLIGDYRFARVVRALRKMGYVGTPRIFNAVDFGVPQRRRRMIFVASRIGEIEYAEPDEIKHRLTVRDAIGRLPRPRRSGDPAHDLSESRSPEVVARIACIPKNGGSRSDLAKGRQLKCHRSCDGFKDVYGRMSWDEEAPTITGGSVNPSKGRFLHPTQNRAITVREAALLQSFPDNYFFSLERGKFAAAAMVGNAFPPEFVRRHAARIRRRILSWKSMVAVSAHRERRNGASPR